MVFVKVNDAVPVALAVSAVFKSLTSVTEYRKEDDAVKQVTVVNSFLQDIRLRFLLIMVQTY